MVAISSHAFARLASRSLSSRSGSATSRPRSGGATRRSARIRTSFCSPPGCRTASTSEENAMPRRRWKNWAGNQTCVWKVQKPAGLDELRNIVIRAAGEGKRVRALGGGFSWSKLVPTSGVIVDMRCFDEIRRLDGSSSAGSEAKGTILEVGAGVTIQELDRFARANYLTLVSPPLYPRPTIGGAV